MCCRQKFLLATKMSFLKSLARGDTFCTLERYHNPKTRSARSKSVKPLFWAISQNPQNEVFKLKISQI